MEFIRENLLKIVVFIFFLIIAIIIFTLLFGRKGLTSPKTYATIEQKLLQAAYKYTGDNPKLLPKEENESNKIKLDTLVNAGYIKEIYSLEDKNVKCSGYVDVKFKDKKNVFIPYLKCGKLYETKTIADYIKTNENIVTTGSGLYQMGDSYIFRGENPNNYLGLGSRLYRIIEIKGNEVKLISNDRLSSYYVWDDRYNTQKNNNYGINDYSKSRIKEAFNQMVKENDPTNDDKFYFSEKEMDKMIKHDICIGKRSPSYGAIDSTNECQVVDKDQKLSLITVSDYAKASIDPNCRSIFDKSCMNYNYFSNIYNSFRTVTASTDTTYEIYYIFDGAAELTKASTTFKTNFVIYIDNTSLYNSGNGTLENPYTVR